MLTAANDVARVYKQPDKICTLEIVTTGQIECRLTGNLHITCDKLISEVSKTDLIFIQHPAKTKVIDLDHPVQENAREQKVAMGFIKWMNFSDEDFYVISEKDIMTIAPMSPTSIMMYKRWVRKEIDRLPEKEREVPMNSSMGLINTVDNARQLLERIYKNPKLP